MLVFNGLRNFNTTYICECIPTISILIPNNYAYYSFLLDFTSYFSHFNYLTKEVKRN